LISAIVLAAGKSERMGRPKALLPTGGTTFLEAVLASIRSSRSIEAAVVVLGHHRDEILSKVDLQDWVYNEEYRQGMTTSFQAGIRKLSPDAGGAMLFLVDHPAPSAATIEALVGAFRSAHIVLPVFQGRRGHPVLFSREVLDEILELGPDRGANSVVRARPERIIQVGVDDPAVVADIDTPEDFERWIGGGKPKP
jgi:molybdenum cofactor cytidylyltransferase